MHVRGMILASSFRTSRFSSFEISSKLVLASKCSRCSTPTLPSIESCLSMSNISAESYVVRLRRGAPRKMCEQSHHDIYMHHGAWGFLGYFREASWSDLCLAHRQNFVACERWGDTEGVRPDTGNAYNTVPYLAVFTLEVAHNRALESASLLFVAVGQQGILTYLQGVVSCMCPRLSHPASGRKHRHLPTAKDTHSWYQMAACECDEGSTHQQVGLTPSLPYPESSTKHARDDVC